MVDVPLMVLRVDLGKAFEAVDEVVRLGDVGVQGDQTIWVIVQRVHLCRCCDGLWVGGGG